MNVLIIEDETAFRQVLEGQFRQDGADCTGVGTGREALELMSENDFDVVVTDLRLPDIDGIEIIKRARESDIEIPFLLMTAYASLKTAVSALKVGAADYLIKPVQVSDVVRRVCHIYDLDRLTRENTLLKKMVQQGDYKYWFPETAASERVQKLVSKVCDTDLTVLILGESGTGKGMTARMLHSTSSRSDQPFVTINCGAIPENLVESELFGHAKGAFTGADTAKDGLFLSASGGTLMLDEVGELSPNIQVKLLTALEDKVIRPVGSTKDRKIDTRILAATNRNLEQMVKDGSFRKDLYFRLNVFEIVMPSLREQKEALPSAVSFFINKYSETYDIGDVEISSEVWDRFNAYSWPGNMRELDNVMERCLLLREGDEITIADLPPALAGDRKEDGVPDEAFSVGDFKRRVQAFEKHLIKQAIKDSGNDRKLASQALGIGLSTLYRKLEELGV